MNKVYLIAYLSNNLGDDIFLKIISERYPSTKFNVFLKNNVKYKIKNVKIYNGILYRGINKFLTKISNNKVSIGKILAHRCKTSVIIGGSMFIEGRSSTKEELKYISNAFILGSNFGPFKDKSYVEESAELFKKCELVSFRDKYSYNLFKNLGDNIQCVPDIVFGLNKENIQIRNSKKVIFSIIDCKSKISYSYEDAYEEKIIELTRYFMKRKFEIAYMSFCKKEGDEEAIERIISKMKDYEKEKISKYYYENDIDEALNFLADSEIIVGSRFHANILGMVLNKTIIPVIYSDKTSNCLEDLEYKGKVMDIRNLEKFNISELTDEDLKYKLDISKYIKESEKHFYKLDEILN